MYYVYSKNYSKLAVTKEAEREQPSSYQLWRAIKGWGSGRYRPLGVRQAQGCIYNMGNITNIL